MYHSNKYNADSACVFCAGIVRHAPWCISHNKAVFYAYEVVIHPEKMTEQDRLALHRMGVAWCGGCKPKEAAQ